MDANLQRRIQRYGWDKAADHYDNGWSRQLTPGQNLMMDLAGINPGDRVIDIACGTGRVSRRAASLVGPGGHVTGVDISAEMVALATATSSAPNLSFVRMDAEALDMPANASDVSLCAFGLMYVPDPDRALDEMLRVLTPGGRAAVAVWGARTHCGWADIFPIVDRRVRSDVCPLFFRLGTGNTLADSMMRAGFQAVVTERMQVMLDYDSEAAALNAAFVAGPVALAHDRFDAATRADAYDEYLAAIDRYRHGNGYHVPGEFVVVAGVKR